MNQRSSTLPYLLGFLLFLLAALLLLEQYAANMRPPSEAPHATSTQVSASAAAVSATSTDPATKSEQKKATTSPATAKKAPITTTVTATVSTATTPAPGEIMRIKDPYATPPFAFTTVNEMARAAVVNILCMSSTAAIRPISGSGVIIDPRGIILTNAHVAQYVLLSESTRIDLQCSIRTGAPAVARWTPQVMYMPHAWVEEHAKEIREPQPLGTGEHDYALLYIGGSVDQRPRPDAFPYLSPDTREAIAFLGDDVLVAAYPAEFLGGTIAQFNLYPGTSITSVKQMQTFRTGSVDAISLGGVIQAQSGSSGGAAVNAWGRLVGILTTTSEGKTTAERDLRAVTLSYIDRDLTVQMGTGLSGMLQGDPSAKTIEFTASTAPRLLKLLIEQLSSR